MPITVELRDYDGNVLGRINEGALELTRLLPPMGDPDFPYLGLIDPYNDTCFNGLQMRAVRPEVRRLKDRLPNAPRVLEDLDDLCYECAETDGFLVFIGD